MNNNPQDKMLKSDEYDILSRFQGGFTTVPEHISLNLRHELRPYQTEALGRYLHYYDSDKNRDQTRGMQLLFNMATGSGKTMIMAALLLDLYKRGQNKIVFFVNTTNIIEKTRENFLDSSSSKYLFAEKIVIDGEVVNVRELTDFSDARDDSINIVFTTIQGLHTTLKAPRENSLTYDDLTEHDLVLLSDEAHHLNGDTKKLNADEKKDNTSWESTINAVMNGNPMNHLFEFTATIDLDDKEIFYKYKNRIIYRYDLRAFREDGYSKDVWIYDVAADLMDRAIQAMIISQYRKKIALAAGVWLKPVILFKSFRIADANDFYDEFVLKVKSISHTDIDKQRKIATGILERAFAYFDQEGISGSDLADELRFDFAEERLISVTKKAITPEDQQRLNSLEDRDNEIRAVFAVDVLDEGWDVLNLFDIVRLYDTRDSKNGRPGKTTMREAQLIGRGARYYPFVLDGDEEKRFVRKFDDNELEPLRVIEQLHYHSASNPKYIQEIRQTLRETGIMPDINTVKRELNLKDSFKESHTYKTGVVWKNEQVEATAIPEQTVFLGGEGYKLQDIYEISVPVGISHDRQIFVDNSDLEAQTRSEEHTFNVTFSRFPKNLVRHAVDRNKKLRYDIVSEKISGLVSLEGFLTGDKQLGGVKIAVTAGVDRYEKLTTDERLFIVEKLLALVANDIALNEKSFEGTKEFKPHPIKEVFDERILRNYTITNNDAEFGISQSHPGSYDQRGSQYYLDLSKEDWHVYDDNFGTSEEKKLVLLMKKLIEDLREKWDDIYLVRNEGSFKIYEFGKPGRAFEPDYVLFANDKRNASVSWQIFIEPKGNHLIEHDAWKQDFLLKLSKEAKIVGEDADTRVIGVPFFNGDIEKQSHVIEEALKAL
ncbi:putative Type III restriction-modification system [Candidatus Saccharimonas aalborgensis]|uniref:Putative Type III restriction-modification system n=1 Tax=Candidatus Saccharimonas aalborgensis TaxID=1332188 RepID=R4PXC4_9BACT|nr:DEAD/DEAH box helicase family protein [Candidatus Saccharimonas aalborgensis]AGL61836.1 putative Type III restriction-modification system [Candidatus Saccharimonas aalborgensis]